jgi:hypothetical protein
MLETIVLDPEKLFSNINFAVQQINETCKELEYASNSLGLRKFPGVL